MKNETANQRNGFLTFLGRSASLNTLFLLEAGLSFLVDVTIGATLGLGVQSDAFYAALTLPQTVGRWLFQSLTNSFMGFFGHKDEGDRSVGYYEAITIVFSASVALSLLLSIGSIGYIPWIIPAAGQETKIKAISLARWLAWMICFLGPVETLRAIFYREAVWWFPSAARLVGSVLTVVVILTIGPSEAAVAAGVILGAFVELVISFLGMRWLFGLRFRFTWPGRPTLKSMTSLVGVPLGGQGVRLLAGVGERALASMLPAGGITAIIYAGRIINALRRSVFRGFVTATIYDQVSGDRRDTKVAMRLLILIAIPLTVILGTLSHPLVAVVFGRGRFDDQAINTLALSLTSYAPALIVIAMSQVPFGIAYGQQRGWLIFGYFASISVTMLLAEWSLLHTGVGLPSFGWGWALSFGFTLLWFYSHATGQRLQCVFSLGGWIRLLGVWTVTWAGTRSFVFVANQLSWPNLFTLIVGTGTCTCLFIGSGYISSLPEFRQILARLTSQSSMGAIQ